MKYLALFALFTIGAVVGMAIVSLLPGGVQQGIADFQQEIRYIAGREERPVGPSIPASRPTATPRLTATPLLTTSSTQRPTVTPTPSPTPTITPVPTPTPQPDLRHIKEKRYMLELINAARVQAGLSPVVLGDNVAAQLHAEASLEGCSSSHWGLDGLKPYMRYSLAGGYQPNGENGLGFNYCITASDRYRPIASVHQEIREAMERWMDSSGHRGNILRPRHKKVNIGLAWDRYNFKAIQHFEGDYVEYDQMPTIEDGILSMSGTVKNGVTFEEDRDLSVQIYYDQPPHSLTRGQVSRTYCYDSGLQVASLIPPLTGGWSYTKDEYSTFYSPCPDPYDVPADAPAPRSLDEAHRFWLAAYGASQARLQPITVPWTTALEWTARGEIFSVTADLGDLLAKHGKGVYSLIVWGEIGSEDIVISEYSIFHDVAPPDTFTVRRKDLVAPLRFSAAASDLPISAWDTCLSLSSSYVSCSFCCDRRGRVRLGRRPRRPPGRRAKPIAVCRRSTSVATAISNVPVPQARVISS